MRVAANTATGGRAKSEFRHLEQGAIRISERERALVTKNGAALYQPPHNRILIFGADSCFKRGRLVFIVLCGSIGGMTKYKEVIVEQTAKISALYMELLLAELRHYASNIEWSLDIERSLWDFKIVVTGKIVVNGEQLVIVRDTSTRELDKFYLDIHRAVDDDDRKQVIDRLISACLADAHYIIRSVRVSVLGECTDTTYFSKLTGKFYAVLDNKK